MPPMHSTRPPIRPRGTMGPPPSRRPASSLRATSVTPSFNGRSSPAEPSLLSASMRMRSPPVAGKKRKERDFDTESLADEGTEATNINVVVRCRGRNDREVRENSGVVVTTDGIKGKSVELAMGSSALSNKTYYFDKVFSPAADQIMIFDEVVVPVLDEVLQGLNCTIFAYGQTGTGKTYTMSGDISDKLLLPDNAGIIPRVLHALFDKLDSLPNSPTSGTAPENSVKVSFIELYNEELRDLLSADDSMKLKIQESDGKRGHSGTLVSGMEESHITNASKGIQLLRTGSHKRQVAATKCNDLSSRSHTVFTITVYTKRTLENGKETLLTGKLNLVDLAGSEDIKQSGAENKRAAEAGLINKSLLTLGRVINALVEKSPHIPYRESKLTRLLQDSLGGRTKTCIIATLSPARSNLEETISTLNYAFRAKNIRNRPQVNQMPKMALLREFTGEIEKLKAELVATQQRNGIYLTQETFDEITTKSESRRILSEEQRDKLKIMESKLGNKDQELFSLTKNLKSVKTDNEATKMELNGAKSMLETTEGVLEQTKKSLAEESYVREAHQKTEERLAVLGTDLITTLGQTTTDIGGLHSKLRRRSELHSVHRQHWSGTQGQVSETTSMVENRLQEFQEQQQSLVDGISTRMQCFVRDELQKLELAKAALQGKSSSFETSLFEVTSRTKQSRDEINSVLKEIISLREDVKNKVGAGLNDLSTATQQISAGIMTEIDTFHTQLHVSYAALGRDFKSMFDDLVRELSEQRDEAQRLRKQISEANQELLTKNAATSDTLSNLMEEEKKFREAESRDLMQRIQDLVDSNSRKQEQRMDRIGALRSEFSKHGAAHTVAQAAFNKGGDLWLEDAAAFNEKIAKSRDNVKTKIQGDFAAANTHTESLRTVTSSVHDQTSRIVGEQMGHLDTELRALDEIVERIQNQNNTQYAADQGSLKQLASTVQSSYSSIEETFTTTFSRIEILGSEISQRTETIQKVLPDLDANGPVIQPLSELRSQVESDSLEEYVSTSLTPTKRDYEFPKTLPRTSGRDSLLAKLNGGEAMIDEDDLQAEATSGQKSPSKGFVFTDIPDASRTAMLNTRPGTASSTISLRELDPNVGNPVISFADTIGTTFIATKTAAPDLENLPLPPLKRQHTTGAMESKVGGKKRGLRRTMADNALGDRENVTMPVNLSASVGAGAHHPAVRRRLRSHERNGH